MESYVYIEKVSRCLFYNGIYVHEIHVYDRTHHTISVPMDPWPRSEKVQISFQIVVNDTPVPLRKKVRLKSLGYHHPRTGIIQQLPAVNQHDYGKSDV